MSDYNSEAFEDDLLDSLSEENLSRLERQVSPVNTINPRIQSYPTTGSPALSHMADEDIAGIPLHRLIAAPGLKELPRAGSLRSVTLPTPTPLATVTPLPQSPVLPALARSSHGSPSAWPSRSPTHLPAGPQPVRCSDGRLHMSEGSKIISTIFLEGLREGISDHEFAQRLLHFESQDIREGVDLVVAGLLHQRREDSEHARRLNDALHLLTITRAVSFNLNDRFVRLVQLPPTQIAAPPGLLPPPPPIDKSDEALVRRVWGDDFREKLGLTGAHHLYRPLARLARFADTLNQDVHRIAHFLDLYRLSRIRVSRRGQRKHITKQDVNAVADDLKNIITLNQRQYSSLLTPSHVTQAADRSDSDSDSLGKFFPRICIALHSRLSSSSLFLTASSARDMSLRG